MQEWPLAIRVVIGVIASLLIFIAGGLFLHLVDGSKHPWINAVYWGLTLFAVSLLFLGVDLATTRLRSSAARVCFYLALIAVAVGIGVFLVTRDAAGGEVIAFTFTAFCLVKLIRMHHTAKHSPGTSQT
jgi:hypothetical protein